MRALVINCSPVRTGATAEIVRIISEQLSDRYDVRSVCIDDYRFGFCTGCRACHTTAECVQRDGVENLMDEFGKAGVIVAVSPSYWADVPGQFKAFIDRCTPWCDTHDPHRTLPPGKRGYAVALRTGPGLRECEKICGTLEHFFGHLHIKSSGRLCLTSVEYRDDVGPREREILDFCRSV